MPHYTVDLRFGDFRVTEQTPGTGVSLMLHGGANGGAVLVREGWRDRVWVRLDCLGPPRSNRRTYLSEVMLTVDGDPVTVGGQRTIEWSNLDPGDYAVYAVFATETFYQIRLLGFRVNADGAPTPLDVDPSETGIVGTNFAPVPYSLFIGRPLADTPSFDSNRYTFEPDRPQE